MPVGKKLASKPKTIPKRPALGVIPKLKPKAVSSGKTTKSFAVPGKAGGTGKPNSQPVPVSARELVVVIGHEFAMEAAPPQAAGAPSSPRGARLARAASRAVTTSVPCKMVPLFSGGISRASRGAATAAAAAPGMLGATAATPEEFMRVYADDQDLDRLLHELGSNEAVTAAYIKPPTYAAVRGASSSSTPDLTPSQGHLDPAPGGIDAVYAWGIPGGLGNGIRVVDVEGDWRHTHEDLAHLDSTLVHGVRNAGWRDHGTAVIGVIAAADNNFGMIGIAPRAAVRCSSIFVNSRGGNSTSTAIQQAADTLRQGDLLLLELHRPGPRSRNPDASQHGFIPVEWWPDDYLAVAYAVRKGVVVVSAAGNGGQNLDDAVYNRRPAGFPHTWQNPFDRRVRDSGSIIVGAGAPPPGTHGRSHGPDRSRLAFSNYGSCVDAQGWGEEVATTGYGDLQGGPEDRRYTDAFNGTSSASPVVVGALACVQGILKAAGKPVLKPIDARKLLLAVGSPQTDAPGRPKSENIGKRPDLKQMIPRALAGGGAPARKKKASARRRKPSR